MASQTIVPSSLAEGATQQYKSQLDQNSDKADPTVANDAATHTQPKQPPTTNQPSHRYILSKPKGWTDGETGGHPSTGMAKRRKKGGGLKRLVSQWNKGSSQTSAADDEREEGEELDDAAQHQSNLRASSSSAGATFDAHDNHNVDELLKNVVGKAQKKEAQMLQEEEERLERKREREDIRERNIERKRRNMMSECERRSTLEMW